MSLKHAQVEESLLGYFEVRNLVCVTGSQLQTLESFGGVLRQYGHGGPMLRNSHVVGLRWDAGASAAFKAHSFSSLENH